MKVEELLKQYTEIEIKNFDNNRVLYWGGDSYVVRDSKDRRKVVIETKSLEEALTALLHAVEIAERGRE